MSDETPDREREIILREREAAWKFYQQSGLVPVNTGLLNSMGYPARTLEVGATIKRLFPLPLRKEPRVVTDGRSWLYRIFDGEIQRSPATSGKRNWEILATASGAQAIADVLDNPTVDVPDNG